MKKVFLFLFLSLLFSTACLSQAQSILQWDKKVYDFGTVNPQKEDVISVVFHFDAIGENPVVIHDVKVTCGCTSAEWTKRAIRPKEKGEVQVFVSIKTLKGFFDKRLFVKTNSNNGIELLRVKGYVI